MVELSMNDMQTFKEFQETLNQFVEADQFSGAILPGISTQFDLYLDLGYTAVVLANYDALIAPRIASILREQLVP